MNTENKRQRQLRSGVRAKYVAYLHEMYRLIERNESIGLNEVCASYKIGNRASAILQKEKIIKKIALGRYIWIGKKPSLDMVDMMIEKARQDSYKKILKDKEVKIEKPFVSILKPIKQEVKIENKNYSFSILWGLIKIQKS
jgi:hypothetical protein